MPPTTGSGRRHLLLVAGAGRSGTSLATGLIGRLGVHIPVPEVTPDESNPKGFGEPRWAVDFHTELLRRLNVAPEDGRPEAWDITARISDDAATRERLAPWLQEQYAVADRVVIKDPRLTWFLDLYRSVSLELDVRVSVLTMLRDPAESVKSRELAYGTKSSATTRMASWLNMMLGLEEHTRTMPRTFVAYDDLMTDWRGALARVERSVGLPLLTGCTPEQEADADSLVDVSLRRARPDWADLGLPAPLEDLARRSFAALQTLTGDDAQESSADLDRLREEYHTMYDDAAMLTRSRVRAARVEERRKKDSADARPLLDGSEAQRRSGGLAFWRRGR